MKDKKAEALEQFMTVVYENGYSLSLIHISEPTRH